MKKKLLISAFLFASIASMNAQLSENFEGTTFPPEGWNLESTNTNFTWELYADGPLEGAQSVQVEYDEALVDQDETLISPEFTVPSAGQLSFMASFSYYWAIDPNDNYDFTVSISTDGGTTWTEIWDETQSPYTVAEDSFTPFTAEVSLSDYSGQSAILAFNYSGVDGAQFVLDDINVSSLASIKELDVDAFSVFPNPASNMINISAKNIGINTLALTDINGRTVKAVNFEGISEAKLNISDLSAGVYMLTITSDNGTLTKKIIKN
ncbi:T9SS type A sorting domain-containing protein [Flavobacterium rhizosphaerae]|uniref:T9SS type A sorting domain-containing protein n=1 Tax=Flavobacterium rhizosphaerae TaxID=3163298 RepID=A0ABW8YW20_9FLAO